MDHEERLKKAREILAIQGNPGNWNYDPYMHGMYNGMELVLATIEGRATEFKEAPEEWLTSDPSGCGVVDR